MLYSNQINVCRQVHLNAHKRKSLKKFTSSDRTTHTHTYDTILSTAFSLHRLCLSVCLLLHTNFIFQSLSCAAMHSCKCVNCHSICVCVYKRCSHTVKNTFECSITSYRLFLSLERHTHVTMTASK